MSDFIFNDVSLSPAGIATGTLKYVTGYTAFDEGTPDHQEGNYFPFKLYKEGKRIQVKKNGSIVKDVDYDPNWIIRIENPTDKFEFILDGKSLVTLDFSQLTLLKPANEVVTVLEQEHGMGNKTVKDLQTNLTISKEAKITGTSLYVTDLKLSGDRSYPDGNYICLHVDKDKLPKGTITLGINNLTNVDTKDYDVLLTVTEESKQKPLRVAVDNKVLYEYDLKSLVLTPKD